MNTPSQAQVRRAIAEAQTIVVKVGSSSLTEPSGHLDPQRLNALVAAIARVRLMGGRVVLVSSGAIAAGFGTLGFDKRPTDVADQQAVRAACRTDPHHRFRHDRPTAVPQRAPYARPPARLGRGADHQ